MKTKHSLAVVLTSILLTSNAHCDSKKIIAETESWVVVEKIEDQSGLLILAKKKDGNLDLMGSSENIYPIIEKNVPEEEAFLLTKQLVGRDIEAQGGLEKTQINLSNQIKKYGLNSISNLTNLAKKAYLEKGIVIPKKQSTKITALTSPDSPSFPTTSADSSPANPKQPIKKIPIQSRSMEWGH